MEEKFFPALLHGADYNYEQWLEYPNVLDKDFEYMKEAGCNVMAVGIFSWAKLEPEEGEFDFGWMDALMDRLAANDMHALLATPSGAKPAWLSEKYPEVCRVGENGVREFHGNRHNHCRTSPVYRDKCVTINTKLAGRYKDHPALLMWHVSNEYNAGECYCDLCLDAFRAWLKKRYKTLEALNKAWWTTFWSHTYTAWEQIVPFDRSIQGLMLDWRRFVSDQTIDFYLAESAPLKKITPQIPMTTNFMAPNPGLDYWRFAGEVDIVSWDNYPRWHIGDDEWKHGLKASFCHDIFRSLKKRSFMMMESSPGVTNWQGTSIPKKGDMHLLSSLQAVAHGSDTVQYFQWRQSRGGEEKFHGAVISHTGHSDTKVFRDVCAVGRALDKMTGITGSTCKAEVAVMYDFQTEWILDYAQLPGNLTKNYQDTCLAHYSAFWKMGVPVDFYDCSAESLDQYKLVIAPMAYMLRGKIAETIKEYAANGGTFIATYLTGLVDESDLCYMGGAPGPLKDILGIRIEDTDIPTSLHPQQFRYRGTSFSVNDYADKVICGSAEILAEFEKGFLEGFPAITRNSYGKGQAWYLAARAGDLFHDSFYSELADICSLDRRMNADLPEGVTVQYRFQNDTEYSFWMNFTGSEKTVIVPSGELEDVLSGEKTGRELLIAPYGIRVMKKL